MSTITRSFSVTAARNRGGTARPMEDIIKLGRATEWDGESITIELDTLPVGNWWGGIAILLPIGAKGDLPAPSAVLRQFDVVISKRVPGPGVENVTKWIKVGFANDMVSYISVTIDNYPAGNRWDGKLRLFVQKPKKGKEP